jgi:alpha-ribazole phosphatase
MVTARWFWIRHAPVTANQGRMYGASDPPAALDGDAVGRKIQALARLLPVKALWVASHLRRARDTAQALAGVIGEVIDPVIEPDFGEQNFGAWQGMTYDAVRALADRPHHRHWFTTADHTPPGGENFLSVHARVGAAVERLNARHPGREVVIVAHGGPIRAAIAHALQLDAAAALAFDTDNLSLTRLDYYAEPGAGSPWRVGCVNFSPQWSATMTAC